MRLKVFACDVLARELYYWSALSENVVDIELMTSENHEYPKESHKILQKHIDHLDTKKDLYDYILIGYGLCGNVLEGIESRNIPLVVPRAHDCITLFMGSKNIYEEYFRKNVGTMYYIESWIERNGLLQERKELQSIGLDRTYEEYVEKYGEENAKYLTEIASEWQRSYDKALYIKSNYKNVDFTKEVKELTQKRNWSYNVFEGNSRIIREMIMGNWKEEEFLIVDKNSRINQTVDENIIDFVSNN